MRHMVVLNEFSMFDYHLFLIAKGPCKKFAKKNVSCHPWEAGMLFC